MQPVTPPPIKNPIDLILAVAQAEGVVADPAAEVLPWGLDDSTVTLRARWWTDSKRANVVHAQAPVILAIFKAARAAAIDLPFPTTVMLFHDQSEETDGDRSLQREGWPAGAHSPRPRRLADPKRGDETEGQGEPVG